MKLFKAPEVFMGKPAGFESDIFSTGVILYAM
jgi:serine/threonine protein kinase